MNNLMDFSVAIRQVVDGKKITRVDWANPEVFAFLNKGILSIKGEDGLNHQWILSDQDLQAFDWIVIE